MNKEQMQNAMLHIFFEILEGFIQRNWVDPTNYHELYAFTEKWILGCKARTFSFEGNRISVDFALGAGSKVGEPTNNTHITVFYSSDNNNYIYQRYSRTQLVELAHARYSYGQLALF